MPDPRVYGLIGLARRARKISVGLPAVERELKSSRAKLILIDADAGKNTQKKLCSLCENLNVPFRQLPTGELERILGDFTVCAALTDENFSAQILKYND